MSAARTGNVQPIVDEATERFIEDMALLFERSGLTRMAGRILAWLLVSDPPYQTAGQIAQALRASKASISTNVRVFTSLAMVERFTRPPDRRDYYRLADDAWAKEVMVGLPILVSLRELTERGLDLPGLASDAQRRLAQMQDFLQFYQTGLTDLVERWVDRAKTSR